MFALRPLTAGGLSEKKLNKTGKTIATKQERQKKRKCENDTSKGKSVFIRKTVATKLLCNQNEDLDSDFEGQ